MNSPSVTEQAISTNATIAAEREASHIQYADGSRSTTALSPVGALGLAAGRRDRDRPRHLRGAAAAAGLSDTGRRCEHRERSKSAECENDKHREDLRRDRRTREQRLLPYRAHGT